MSLLTGIPGVLIGILLSFPLPALLGPMIVNAVLCLSGIRMKVHNRLLIPVFTVIGWQLGSRFTPDIWLSFSRWLLAGSMLIFWVILSVLVGMLYFHRIAGYDKRTAFYAALPGALASILSFLEEVKVNQRQVIVAQTVRIFLVIGMLPFIFSIFMELPDPSLIPVGDQLLSFNEISAWCLMMITSIMIMAALHFLHIPSPHLLGSTMVSAAFYTQGWLSVPLPNMALLIALYVLGCILGSRFSSFSWKELAQTAQHAVIVSLILISLSCLGAIICAWLLQLNILSMLLAFVPGGVHEMTVIAFAYDRDPLLVAFLHLVRLTFIILSLPFIALIFGRK